MGAVAQLGARLNGIQKVVGSNPISSIFNLTLIMFNRIFHKHIEKLIKTSDILNIDKDSKIVIFSDCHRGSGDRSDDFFHNKSIFVAAMNYYKKNNFTYIEIGDGDELWENANFELIKEKYRSIFEIFDELFKEKRFYMLWGNHNRSWKNKNQIRKQLSYIIDEKTGEKRRILDNLKIPEALILKYNGENTKNLFLIHGHQGEILNDFLWWFGRFFIKTFWKFVQIRFGVPDPTSPARNFRTRRKVDERFIAVAEKNNLIVIVGHTHFPIFPGENEVSYFNDGSCVHPRCITGIEIVNGKISLIKWYRKSISKGDIKIIRKILEGPSELKIT